MAPPVNTTSYSRVPPGFRFHPTDEELVNYYLRKKVALEKFELDVIREVDLNKLEPWDLHERCKIDNTQTEWYFFSHKDKKYPTGSRTNRATAAGFWKATGRDKAVYSNCKRIGMRKTLVFYRGRAPHGMKTDWIMHEYRMDESENATKGFNEEGWVICRVFEKRNHQRKGQENDSFGIEEEEEAGCLQKLEACENPQEHSARSRPAITCKQEADFEECVLSQNTFLQLPPLESPKMSSNQPCFNPSIDLDKALVENGKRTEFAHQLYSLELSGIAYSKSFVSDDSFTDYADSRQLTEWGMIESSIPKDMRYNAEISFNGDMHYPVHKQQHLEYPTSYEIDLWNFTR